MGLSLDPVRLRYVIELPPVTKKNSQQILKTKSGRSFIAPSAAYKNYAKAAMWYIRPRPLQPLTRALTVKCIFYIPTHRRVDLTNLLEAVDDILVERGVIADDNSTIVASHDGSRVRYDKEHPRTEIEIFDFFEEDEDV